MKIKKASKTGWGGGGREGEGDLKSRQGKEDVLFSTVLFFISLLVMFSNYLHSSSIKFLDHFLLHTILYYQSTSVFFSSDGNPEGESGYQGKEVNLTTEEGKKPSSLRGTGGGTFLLPIRFIRRSGVENGFHLYRLKFFSN